MATLQSGTILCLPSYDLSEYFKHMPYMVGALAQWDVGDSWPGDSASQILPLLLFPEDPFLTSKLWAWFFKMRSWNGNTRHEKTQRCPIIPAAWLGDSELVKKQWLVDEPLVLSCSLESPDVPSFLRNREPETQNKPLRHQMTMWVTLGATLVTRSIYSDIILSSIGLSFWSLFIWYVFWWQLPLCRTVRIGMYRAAMLRRQLRSEAGRGLLPCLRRPLRMAGDHNGQDRY